MQAACSTCEVTQLFNKLNSTINNLELLKKGSNGQIGIGFVASAIQSVLPGLLKRFNKECPGIKFQLEELTNKEQLAAPATGRDRYRFHALQPG